MYRCGLEKLSEAFATVVNPSEITEFDQVCGCEQENVFKLRRLKVSEVGRALSQIKSSTAAGHDTIPAFLLSHIRAQ